MTLLDLLKTTSSNVIILSDKSSVLLKIMMGFNPSCLNKDYLSRKIEAMYARESVIYVHLEEADIS